jgi:hypothetical protein
MKINIKGNRTIATVALYVSYRIAVGHGWLQPIQELDVAFMGAIVIFFKSGLENALKEAGPSTTVVQGDQTVDVKADKIEVKGE